MARQVDGEWCWSWLRWEVVLWWLQRVVTTWTRWRRRWHQWWWWPVTSSHWWLWPGSCWSKTARQCWSVFQLVIVKMKVLGNFPPAAHIKEVICSSLIRVSLFTGNHARSPRDPHSFFFMIPENIWRVSSVSCTCLARVSPPVSLVQFCSSCQL